MKTLTLADRLKTDFKYPERRNGLSARMPGGKITSLSDIGMDIPVCEKEVMNNHSDDVRWMDGGKITVYGR